MHIPVLADQNGVSLERVSSASPSTSSPIGTALLL